MSSPGSSNRLASESSLYLLQHAHNPVSWYPWCDEAFERSRAEDLPILLSIGYSACHWCHVMAHQCFENERIAALMNADFVCIKVDREERPDVDQLYMKALQAMTGRGGWPMTVFLTPAREPFYAGTYFPPVDRGRMPGFPRVLAGVLDAYRNRRPAVERNAGRVVGELRRAFAVTANPSVVEASAIATAADRLLESMDADNGGFGSHPKFPQTMCLQLLMGIEARRPDSRRRALLQTSFDAMADGGIYDHVGGGFHRYSVDGEWRVPHFEKMLYDQAAFVQLYADAWRLFGHARYRRAALGTLAFVQRELRSPGGGFFAALDADSEGREGKYYVWTPEEVRDRLPARDAEWICRAFDVSDGGNFDGGSVLHRAAERAQAAPQLGMDPGAVEEKVARSLEVLRLGREARVRPGRDEKILADWNGLMIGAAATAGALFECREFVDMAEAAADYCRATLRTADRLVHSSVGGRSGVHGFLDDYAFFGRGCLELYCVSGRPADLETALWCARSMVAKFQDADRGGFYFTANDGESLLARTVELHDGAVPSGNAVALELLWRLHHLTGDEDCHTAAVRAASCVGREALDNPYGSAHLLCVLDRALQGWTSVVVCGDGEDADRLAATARRSYLPESNVLRFGSARMRESVGDPLLDGKEAVNGRATAYVCRDQVCAEPVQTVRELQACLAKGA